MKSFRISKMIFWLIAILFCDIISCKNKEIFRKNPKQKGAKITKDKIEIKITKKLKLNNFYQSLFWIYEEPK